MSKQALATANVASSAVNASLLAELAALQAALQKPRKPVAR
jgi:hypothetical protein